jgi:hypothetical protein
MARVITLGLIACALTLSFSPAAFSASQLDDAWARVKSFTVENKDAAVAYGKQLVQDTDAKIKELQTKADKSSGDAKGAYERSIDDLKEKRDAAAAKLDDMGKASGKAWDATKQGFADAYKELGQSYDKTVESFKK